MSRQQQNGLWRQVQLYQIHTTLHSGLPFPSLLLCSSGGPWGHVRGTHCAAQAGSCGHAHHANHLNKEQNMTIKVYEVYDVSSFLLRMMDPLKYFVTTDAHTEGNIKLQC